MSMPSDSNWLSIPVTDPNQPEPFAPPYVLNQSSVTIENGEELWPVSAPSTAPAARSPQRRPWLAPVVIIGIVALIGGLVAAGAAEFRAIASQADPYDNGSLIGVPDAPPGSDGIPTTKPTPILAVCPPNCFTVASAGLMVPNGSLQGSMPISGLSVSPDFQHPTTAAAEYRSDVAVWAAQSPNPLVCFFTDSRSPVSPALGGPDSTADDAVAFLGESTDDSHGSSMTQSARFFASSAAATDYLKRLQKQIGLCHLVDPAVDSAASFDLPSSVATVSFVEASATTTTYVFDFQRANAVVRFRVVTSDAIDENAVRHFLGTWATTDLAQLDPK
ncbi:MAG: hypothetical protein ABUT11_03810 [Leifsonia sp.]